MYCLGKLTLLQNMYVLRKRTNLNIHSAQRKFTPLLGKDIRALARDWAQRLRENMALAAVLSLTVWPPYGNSSKVLSLGFLINVVVAIRRIEAYLLGVRDV